MMMAKAAKKKYTEKYKKKIEGNEDDVRERVLVCFGIKSYVGGTERNEDQEVIIHLFNVQSIEFKT
jgi:hypothetical protein